MRSLNSVEAQRGSNINFILFLPIFWPITERESSKNSKIELPMNSRIYSIIMQEFPNYLF